jgi:hypothetical protein
VIEQLAVAGIVVLAAAYVGAKYLPAAWRRRIVYALSGGAAESKLSRWLGTGSSCGSGCDSCKSCAPAAPADAPPEASPAGQRRVIKLHRRR